MDVWDLPYELLELWHSYRLPIVVSAIAVAAILYLSVYRNKKRRFEHRPRSPPALEAAKHHPDLQLFSNEKPKQTLIEKGIDVGNGSRGTKPKRISPKRIMGSKLSRAPGPPTITSSGASTTLQPIIFFSSLSGTTEKAATELQNNFLGGKWEDHENSKVLRPQVFDLSYIDYDDYFITAPRLNVQHFYMILVPTYNIDTQLDNFLEHLKETHNDFRIDTAPLAGILGYSVFGFGDKEGWPTEEEGFCSQAKELDKWLAKLTGRKRAFPLGLGDVKSDAKQKLSEWQAGVEDIIRDLASGRGLGEGVPGSGAPVESDDEDIDEIRPKSIKRQSKTATTSDDLEDIKVPTDNNSGPLAIDFTTFKKSSTTVSPPVLKEMVPANSPTHAALTKQGYSIIGSHSGVKICRWTKSALRGRGSCYKYSFYGIASHLCMETTPSLSCSNKCVFCWRHGTNPVGTTWRWITDAPEFIFEGVKEAHYKKIKMMRGIPGVRADRFIEAGRIRHCALSLVGEPIFYPRINELLGLMHKERISTFLVCNAQHPEQLQTLTQVTQLYVSIDASNKDALRRIDRPLHRDFWERFLKCLDILRERRDEQRTVFRLTLVKGFNLDEEASQYARLVERARPSFVEVKGVTYCGTSESKGAGLTMQNVPYHYEVRQFVEKLKECLRVEHGLSYGVAAEHAHSCCMLLGDEDRFRKEGRWRTWIDYGKFFELLESGEKFGPEDYVGPETPEWALDGNGGFDPRDERVDRKGRKKQELTEQT
ncbi:MAG: hypothetical protein M1820_003284 [Bogoriella megaspora]|nr:MAG: hypothetical protein M1820_003284 [Bogoriella megaspora]